MVLGLISALVNRYSVSRMQDFFYHACYCDLIWANNLDAIRKYRQYWVISSNIRIFLGDIQRYQGNFQQCQIRYVLGQVRLKSYWVSKYKPYMVITISIKITNIGVQRSIAIYIAQFWCNGRQFSNTAKYVFLQYPILTQTSFRITALLCQELSTVNYQQGNEQNPCLFIQDIKMLLVLSQQGVNHY